MNFAGMCASLVVAIDCAQKATGDLPQSLFGPNARWLWWVVAFAWLVTALGFLVRCVQSVTR
jgi:hypothetical protein